MRLELTSRFSPPARRVARRICAGFAIAALVSAPSCANDARTPPPSPGGAITASVTLLGRVDGVPTGLVPTADGGTLVATQKGLIERLDGSGNRPVLDLSARVATEGEQGLLNIIPISDGRVAAMWSSDDGFVDVASWAVTADGSFDPASEQTIVRVPHALPYHKGGGLVFVAPSTLYIGIGDMALDFGPQPAAQDAGRLAGAILKVSTERTASPAPPEVLARGLRNPWRMTLGADQHTLWIGDVGEHRQEEIDRLDLQAPGGQIANFGWPRFEGTRLNRADVEVLDPRAPTWTARHADERCGVVVGPPAVAETLVVGDLCSETIQLLRLPSLTTSAGTAHLPERPITFSNGPKGEMFVGGSGGAISAVSFAVARSPARSASSSSPSSAAPRDSTRATTTSSLPPGVGEPPLCAILVNLSGVVAALDQDASTFRVAVERSEATMAELPPGATPELRTAVDRLREVLDQIRSAAEADGWNPSNNTVRSVVSNATSGRAPYDDVPTALNAVMTWGSGACRG